MRAYVCVCVRGCVRACEVCVHRKLVAVQVDACVRACVRYACSDLPSVCVLLKLSAVQVRACVRYACC